MDIRGIGDHVPLDPKATASVSPPPAGTTAFREALESAITRVDALQHGASHSVNDLATGQTADIHQTMIALEKADLSFQLMMQVRNKLVAAYEEVTRMQI